MVIVLDRVFLRHPELTVSDVETAWEARVKTQYRLSDEKPYLVAVGVASNGKLVELIAFEDGEDTVVFHALTPPTKKLLRELRML